VPNDSLRRFEVASFHMWRVVRIQVRDWFARSADLPKVLSSGSEVPDVNLFDDVEQTATALGFKLLGDGLGDGLSQFELASLSD
jgi:hypothetical protein